MGTEITKYSEFDLDAMEQVDKAAAAIASAKVWRFEEGTNVVRFLPARAGQPGSAAFRVTGVHYVEPVRGMTKKVVFNCPRIEKVGPCLVCEKFDQLASTGNPVDRDMAFQLRARVTVYANVLDRESPDMGPRPVQFGKGVWDKLKALRKSKAGGDFTNPGPDGFDVVIEKTGSGLDTEYSVFGDRHPRVACDEAAEFAEVMSKLVDLNRFVDTNVPEELIEAYGNLARAGRVRPASNERRRTAVSDARATTEPDPYDDAEYEEG